MGFFKRNKWELIIAGITALSIIGFAILAPYAFPYVAAAAIYYSAPYVIPVLWSLGITISATSILATVAATSALVFGVLAGLFTKAIQSCFCTPEASEAVENNQPQNVSNNLAQEYSPSDHQTNQQARTYSALNVIPVIVGDATQTTSGPESRVNFQDESGGVVATATYNHYTKKYQPEWDPLNTFRKTEEVQQELMPVYRK